MVYMRAEIRPCAGSGKGVPATCTRLCSVKRKLALRNLI